MKIVTIIGARPQFIKAAAISRALRDHNNKVENQTSCDNPLSYPVTEIIVHTGQHFDLNMSDIFFKEMQIPKPSYNLGISNLSHGAMTGKMIEKIEEVLLKEKPDLVLVYGDTNTTLAGSLAARKLNIKLAHIEAGLRNHDFSIPEEVNRVISDRISDILFVSTDVAVKNLIKEGFESFGCRIVRTGDLMVDNVVYYSQEAASRSVILNNIGVFDEKYILCTLHRASNTVLDKISEIMNALNRISEENTIIFPVHPRTRQVIKENNLSLSQSILVINPVGYIDMLRLLMGSSMVITDSGGLQKESYVMKKNSLLIMEYTPWEELVDNGFSKTTEITEEAIYCNFQSISKTMPDYTLNLYGNGNAAQDIVKALLTYLQETCKK